MSFVQGRVRDGNVVVNASTGFGKTPLILASLLPTAVEKGYKIIWAVRTGNETDRPIEELKVICKRVGVEIFGLSYRGKRDMCLLLRDLRLKGEIDYDDVSFLCKTSQKNCKYLTNYRRRFTGSDVNLLMKEPRLYTEVLEYCEARGICPYRLQSDLAPYADVISLSYNYIIDESISWAMQSRINYSTSYLVVDEAHNLQNVCADLNSERITSGTVENSIREMKSFGADTETQKFLSSMKSHLDETSEKLEGEDAEFDVFKCISCCSKSIEDFGRTVKVINRYGMIVRKKQLTEGKTPRSSLHHLGRFWDSALQNLNVEGLVFIATAGEAGRRRGKKALTVEMWDMRSNVVLQERWKLFNRSLFCSGTLSPVEAFAETVGLVNYSGRSFPSPFTKRNAVSLVAANLTSKGEQLKPEAAKSYLSMIRGFILSLDANVAVFSASYRIQDTLLKHGLKDVVEGNGRKFFLEHQGMSGKESRSILRGFKECVKGGVRGVLCATMTGRFAEGADFPGKELEGIFLVGIPFERLTTRTRLYLEYYRRLYGDEKGTFYGYILPAVRRASQSLGRALRSKGDTAIFILGDRRYGRFMKLLPDFVQGNYKIIRNEDDLNREVKDFRG